MVDPEEIERLAVKWILKHSSLPAEVVFEAENPRLLLEAEPLELDAVLIDPDRFGSHDDSAGFGVVEDLARRFRDAAIVVTSATKTGSQVQQAMRSGSFDYLFKPLSQEELVTCLRRVEASRAQAAAGHDRTASDPAEMDLRLHAQNEFLYDLVFGNVDSPREIWRRSRLVGLTELPNTALVVCIDNFALAGTDRSEAWKRSLRREVLGLVRRAVDGLQPPPHVFLTGEDRAAVLVRVPEESAAEPKDSLLRLADRVRQTVASSATVTVSVGVGNPRADATNLHLSFLEAQRALGRKFFLGENLVVHVDEVASSVASLQSLSGRDRIPSLIARVRAKDRCGALKLLDEILDGFFAATKSAEAVKLAVTETLLTVLRIAYETGVYSSEVLDLSAEWVQAALRSSGASELRQIVRKALEQIIDALHMTTSDRRLTLLRRAIDHINENYSRELTLKEVARIVWLSPAYLSHLFSKELGWSFIEYLTKVRVDRARELLLGTSLNVSEVASEVGYRDASYFSRVFRSATGQSPTEFRLGNPKLDEGRAEGPRSPRGLR